MKVKLYSRYDVPKGKRLKCTDPSRTQQQFCDESNINTILAKYIRTGYLETVGPGTYEDVSHGIDYRQALDVLHSGQEMFAGLPATIRKRFDNDPSQFMDFIHNPDNIEEGIEIGLFNRKPSQNSTQKTEKAADEAAGA